jgi:hypothetical protein
MFAIVSSEPETQHRDPKTTQCLKNPTIEAEVKHNHPNGRHFLPIQGAVSV